MKKNIIKEYFSIPNLLGYFRILLIPIYLFLYLGAESTEDYYLAAGVMMLSFLSDFFDGKIARKFHMITEFGKILDPIADKLTQAAMAVSFSFRYPAMMVLLIIFLCKEGFMGIVGAYMLKKGYRMNGAQMHGKICTAVLDLVMLIVLVLPEISFLAVNILVCISVVFMLVSLYRYAKMYWKVWKEQLKEGNANE
ncbi:MAG: CDP-alcohol phosphatidyltransferase family protein [Clostridiales bacterium]|nr:CDP-alcohol phosphatidyltransferase family protein [Clostridiales bacterium]